MDKHEKVKSKIRFLGYQVDEIQFKKNNQFHTQDKLTVDFGISVGVDVDIELKRVIVMLEANVFENATEKNYPFSLDVKINGGFETEEDITQEELVKIGEINGTATLFPFLRSIVAGICSQANVNPVMLPLVNVYNLVQENKDQDISENNESIE